MYEIIEQSHLSEGLRATKYKNSRAIEEEVKNLPKDLTDNSLTLRKIDRQNTGWGYFDVSGNLRIPGMFEQAGDFMNGIAVVKHRGISRYHGNTMSVIDRKGDHLPGGYFYKRIIRLRNGLFISEKARSRTGKSRIFYYAQLRHDNFKKIDRCVSLMAAKGCTPEYTKAFCSGKTKIFNSVGSVVYETESEFSNVQVEKDKIFNYDGEGVTIHELGGKENTRVEFSEDHDFRLKSSHR